MSKYLASTFLIILITVSVGSCSPAAQPAAPDEVILVTSPVDPTITPTPFQPEENTAFPSIAPSLVETATIQTDLLLTPTNTPFQPSTEIPTLNLGDILPAAGTSTPIFVSSSAPTPFPILTDNDTVTFALLGSDTRAGSNFRTDTMVIVAVRPKTGQVTLISIPRDLWVYIPEVGMQRINTAYEFGNIYRYPGGGSALLKDTILYNLGIRIDHTALVDFDGFRRIVNTLDGVDVPVACAYTDWRLIDPSFDPENENNWELYTVGPGLIHMDGELALWYARSRSKSSDFDRGRRSQEVLRALYTRGLQVNAIAKIPELYDNLHSTVTTDLSLAKILALSPLALQLNNADIRSYYIGKEYVTSWTTPSGAAVLLPNGPAIQALLQQALSPSTAQTDQETILIEVRNGTSNPDWDALAAERLHYAGYETRIAPADRNDYPATLLYDLTSTPDLQRIASLLAILGLQPSALVSVPLENDVPYILILGADYQPCFNPAELIP